MSRAARSSSRRVTFRNSRVGHRRAIGILILHWLNPTCTNVVFSFVNLPSAAETRPEISFLCFPFLSVSFIYWKKRAQVTNTFHQPQSIDTLWLLSSHSISHSVDYAPRGAQPDNQAGNPILCHIKCQARSFRCRVITAGGDSGGRGAERKGENKG